MENDIYVTCAVNMEWLNAQGAITRKVNYRTATLRLIRNDMRDILLEVTAEKTAAQKLIMKGINVFNKFMSEGKATIKFKESRCTVMLSNAPPSQLQLFLRTLFIKMTGGRTDPPVTPKTLREKLLNSNPNAHEDISPVTNDDILKAKKFVSKCTITTPSPPNALRKRKLNNSDSTASCPVAKKLYAAASFKQEELKLSSEQERVLQACLSGRNVFFTGSAGTGKSFLLRKIISALPPDVTVATASTGVAACHIGGITLHSFCGIGSGEGNLSRCLALATRNASQNWRRCRHLIIDEISMVDGEYFEKIEAVAREVRRNDRPFGGIQLILCGDFLQLPPVFKQNTDKDESKKFCFQSPAWASCIQNCYELQTVHRQKDLEFVKILNSIRIGRVTDEISTRLVATGKQMIEQDGILATRLCSHMNDANTINSDKLSRLPGDLKLFLSRDSDGSNSALLDQQTTVAARLELKVGAQVMLLKNISVGEGLVNGARGVVTRFDAASNLPVVRFKSGKEHPIRKEKFTVRMLSGGIMTREQIPLRLAWAFSIHKSQGLTLDCVEMSLSKVFEPGQAYVALSRAQSLDALRVLDFDSKQVWADVEVLKFYRGFRRSLQQNDACSRVYKLGEDRAKKDLLKTKREAIVRKIAKSLDRKPLVNIC